MNAGERKQKQIIKLNIKNLTQIKQKEKIKQSNQTKKREISNEENAQKTTLNINLKYRNNNNRFTEYWNQHC